MQHLAGEFPGLLLTNIDEDALQAFEATWVGHLRHPRCRSWDWRCIVESFNANPKQFQMAIWKQDADGSPGRDLHALVIGATTKPKATVQVNFLESAPYNSNPFKGSILPITEIALTFYGFLLGAKRIRIKDALPEVVPYYRSRGFIIENPAAPRHNLTKELQ